MFLPYRCDTMSYYAITIFAKWGIPPTSVAILFQVNSICFLLLCSFKSVAILFQATITVGYLLSPLVMRRVDTRPQVKVNFKWCWCWCRCWWSCHVPFEIIMICINWDFPQFISALLTSACAQVGWSSKHFQEDFNFHKESIEISYF